MINVTLDLHKDHGLMARGLFTHIIVGLRILPYPLRWQIMG